MVQLKREQRIAYNSVAPGRFSVLQERFLLVTGVANRIGPCVTKAGNELGIGEVLNPKIDDGRARRRELIRQSRKHHRFMPQCFY